MKYLLKCLNYKDYGMLRGWYSYVLKDRGVRVVGNFLVIYEF